MVTISVLTGLDIHGKNLPQRQTTRIRQMVSQLAKLWELQRVNAKNENYARLM